MSALPPSFLDAVQHNCDVSDSQHADHYSLCVYLMHMREYFRWERQLGPDAVLGADAVGEWVHKRESYWDTLEGASQILGAYRRGAAGSGVTLSAEISDRLKF